MKEKKKELKQKIERKELLENINNNDIIIETPRDKNNLLNDEDFDFDIYKKSDKVENKRFNSAEHKKQIEQNVIRKDSFVIDNISNKERCELNKNCSLQNLVLQLKIYELPEIFNLCLMNNLTGLKTINIGTLDEISFIGFMEGYKKNHNKLINLTSLKIGLDISITYFSSIEKYLLEFININSPKIEEKFLFTDLQIIHEKKMRELIELVYLKASIPKLVIQISSENEHMLSKVLSQYINEKKKECSIEMNALIILMDRHEFKRLYNQKILECLTSFYGNNKNRAIICKENPNPSANLSSF